MMINNKMDYNIYNELFNTMLENDNTNVVKGRFNIENLSIQQKADYIFDLIKSFSTDYKICRILFWEKDEKIMCFIKKYAKKNCHILNCYQGKDVPGICILNINEETSSLLKKILISHLGFELGEDFSINVRLQIYIKKEELRIIIDVYDDRGFNMYILD